MFEMHGVSKSYDAVQALKNASLTVKPGEIRALLGANGSGKSTMVKVLAGLVKPDNGEILIDGKPVKLQTSRDSKQLGIATAFQDLSLIPTMTVLDNIKLNCETVRRYGTIDSKKDRQDVEELLARFCLKCDPDAYVQTLMPSTQSMLEVVKAVFVKPRLLLLDEATATLHQAEIDALFGVIRQLRDEGTAIVYVTHRMKEIAQLCDSAVIMRNGETVHEMAGDELEDLDQIVYHMTGQYPEKTHYSHSVTQAASQEKPLVEVKNLKFSPKVQDINMCVYRGEIVGIGGLDGQGQSEVIRLLLGEFKPEDGKIIYKGRETTFKNPFQAVAANIGFISGERNREAIFDRLTIAENLFVGNSVRGKLMRFISNARIKLFSQKAVEDYNIKIGELEDSASSLSGGNQQKLVVARWIALKPDLLLLDDPTKGVDVNSRREIHQILKECTQEGMTIIVSSSDNDELITLADRIYIFYEGKVVSMLAGANKTQERLSLEMLGIVKERGERND
ncbi:MAG: sugar ABC transporter ATP-binding protein [Christensenellales bacterium]|jgi:ribose transport system ATP-binding protein